MDDYAPADPVLSLISHGLAARQHRLSADDMLSVEEATCLVGASRATINTWIAKGRAIGLSQTGRGLCVPKWQFEPATWDALQSLSSALGTTEGWALLSFLESPNGGLDGRTPRQAIEQGQAAQVISLAEHDGA